jgi:hypothetical protein
MKIRYFLIIVIFISIISCKKDGSISLKIQSISSNIVPTDGSLEVVLSFTANSGDVIDSIYMKKIRINQDSADVPASQRVRDSLFLIVPSYPGSSKGQLMLDLDNTNFLASAANPPQVGNPPQNESDSLILRFAVKDNANHTSDTVTTGLIVVLR